ncbi:MAG: response regulator [Chloroflexota bacterium]|nr:response regulator [Chloroflexota bacterium]
MDSETSPRLDGKKILIVDDDPTVIDIIRTNLEMTGYEVIASTDGEQGLELATSQLPDLVLLDLNLPSMNGYEICSRIRKQLSTSHIPIIMLTAAASTGEKVAGMRSGADDFVTKPFDALELVARVEMNLHRASRNRDLNPLTGLPGNRAIDTVLQKHMDAGEEFAALYVDLDNFKSYNDAYGFHSGDDMIKLTARCLVDAVSGLGSPEDFVGHIGGDDFLVVTRPEAAEPIARDIVRAFDEGVLSMYDERDRERGFMMTADRRGIVRPTPLVSISIAIVSNSMRRLHHVAELSHIAADVKNYVKRLSGSNFAFDRRRDDKAPTQLKRGRRSRVAESIPSSVQGQAK